MSHLVREVDLKEAIKMDGGFLRAPAPRYQKKARDTGLESLCLPHDSSVGNASSLNITDNGSSFLKTPHNGSFFGGKSPSRNISPGRNKSPGRIMPKLAVRSASQKSPSRLTPSTPHNQGDRFIPCRSTSDLERSHHLLISSADNSSRDSSTEDLLSIKQKEYKETMLANLNDGAIPEDRILSFKGKAPQSKESHVNNLKILYSTGKPSAPKSSNTRRIPSAPEKVLDAPELLDDYYLHLLDWSINNHLSVALGSCIFIWNGGDGSIMSLTQFEEPDYVCSLSWIKEGNVLAVGLSNSTIQLWDVGQQKLIRTMGGHDSRISSLSWSSFILSSGSRSGQIIHHDVRIPDHVTATLSNHTQEVCGLKWSLDNRLLASGGNDNLLNLYDSRSTTPLHSLTGHQAAVKGLAWSPWQNNLLASGGGTADRTIKLWNCSVGTCLKTVDTNSQVSSILWSTNYKEIISGHGYIHNQLTIWKYPNFSKVTDLSGHTGRVLEMCLSPDGQTVISAAADETLRLWKCWAVDKKEKKSHEVAKSSMGALARTIR